MTYCQRKNFFSWIVQWKVNIYPTDYQKMSLFFDNKSWKRYI